MSARSASRAKAGRRVQGLRVEAVDSIDTKDGSSKLPASDTPLVREALDRSKVRHAHPV